jgi:hypothetical protein
MKITFVLKLAMVLSIALGVHPALAGKTLLEKDFVGSVENLNKVGGGDMSAASDEAGRFAGSNNTIAQGPPPGASEDCDPSNQQPNSGGCALDRGDSEGFVANPGTGMQRVTGAESANGYPVFVNLPNCGGTAGVNQIGQVGRVEWDIALDKPVVSDIQLQLCLDVRACNQKELPGQKATVPVNDLVQAGMWEAPPILRVIQERGQFNQFQSVPAQRFLTNLVNPTLSSANWPLPGFNLSDMPDLPKTANPAANTLLLEESVAFVGKDCITKTIKNDGLIAGGPGGDSLRVQLTIPSSTNVQVRVSQDAAAMCYIATDPFSDGS